jgi:hypothetical protein
MKDPQRDISSGRKAVIIWFGAGDYRLFTEEEYQAKRREIMNQSW